MLEHQKTVFLPLNLILSWLCTCLCGYTQTLEYYLWVQRWDPRHLNVSFDCFNFTFTLRGTLVDMKTHSFIFVTLIWPYQTHFHVWIHMNFLFLGILYDCNCNFWLGIYLSHNLSCLNFVCFTLENSDHCSCQGMIKMT